MPTDPLTDDELDAIQRRCDAATKGPWRHEMTCIYGRVVHSDGAVVISTNSGYGFHATEVNGDFIAHSRTDVPRLVDDVRTLRAEVDELGCTLGDEEASHGETLRLWNIAKEQVETLTQQRDEAQATVESIATMLGWINVPPRESLERNLSALRQRLENAESEVERLRARVAELEGGAK